MMLFRVLGPLEVDAGNGPVTLGGPKQRAVLAHLVFRANQLVLAETLIEGIWGEDPPDQARNVVQTYIHHLRKALGRDRIESHGPGYRLTLDPAELDAARFAELMRDAKKALPVDPNTAVATLEDALALWRGPALADLADHSSLLAEAARLDELRLEAQEARIEGLLAAGAQARAVGELETLVARHPWRESLWGLLMLALYREGRQADALNAFQRAREILADELGIDPSPDLVRLHERVLHQDPGLDLRGEPLRGYRLLEKVDDGPTGVVFRAIQPHVERDVAVKIFHQAIAADPAFVRRFERDAQAVAALEHPHIAPIYDYWREPGRAYLVSRYLRGGSLRAFEERGERLDRSRALRVLEQVALGLAFAHRQGITHGNVGSSNILFDQDGNAYLGDFLIRGGPTRDAAEDVLALARLAERLLPSEPALAEFADRAATGHAPEAGALAEVVRRTLEPTAVAAASRGDERNPYKGLRAFTESDARDFFGRGELTRRLVASLAEIGPGSRFLAVVGPSGSGKSSVVRAGLVPAIREGALDGRKDVFVAEMLPGAHPMEELETALLGIAVRPVSRLRDRIEWGSRGLLESIDLVAPPEAEVVLVVDQFEEAFTQTVDERERELFLESLRVAVADPESRLRVIVTLRADFYDRPLVYPRFGELLAERTEAVPPLTPDEYEQAIRGPAEGIGVRPEPGLVAEIIADIAHQPGALPLLQYALTELFERRDENRLTLTAYREIGGIAGALSTRADRIYESTDPSGRRATRQVFLRLVTLGEGRQDTRRRVLRSELDALDLDREAIERAIDTFGRHRLLTFDREPSTREPTVEIAHEALLGAWGRLRTWIDEAREDLRQERGLARAAAEWRGSEDDPSFLVRGARLEQLEAWAGTTDLAMGRPEHAYLKASIDQRHHERAEEERRLEREGRIERRSARRLRGLVAVFAVAALVAGTLTIVATDQRGRAQRETRIATARELAAASMANLDLDPELGVLLAVEAVRATRSVDGTVLPEAEEALHRAIVASRLDLQVPGLGGLLAWSPREVFVTEGPQDSGLIDIRDSKTGKRVLSFRGHDGDVTDVAFSRDGSKLASTGDDGYLKVWDASTGRLLSSLRGTGEAWGPSFSADGSLVSAAWYGDDGQVQVLDPSTDRVVSTIYTGNPIDSALSPDGRHVAVVTPWMDGAVGTVFDVRTGEQEFTLPGPNCCGAPNTRSVAWSPNGRLIAASSEGTARVWDAKTGTVLHTLRGHNGFVFGVAWSPHDSSRLVTGGSDGTAKVWEIDADGVQPLWSLSAQESQSGIVGVAFSSDGTQVMAGDAGITAVKVWDLGPTGDAEWANLPAPGLPGAEFMPDGRRVMTGSLQGVVYGTDPAAVTIWDPQTGRGLRTIGPPTDFFRFLSFDVSPDGSKVALGGGSNPEDFGGSSAVRTWNTSTGEELWHLGDERDVQKVAFSPDGEYVATADWNGIVYIVDDRDGRLIKELHGPDDYNSSDVAFSSDGEKLATAEYAGSIHRVRVWDWRRKEVLLSIDAGGSLPRVDFDPSGPRVVVSGRDGLAEIWDVQSRERVAVLAGPPGGVNDLAYSSDGSRIAAASEDGLVRLFDAETGAQQLSLPRSGCAVEGVAFSPDGTKLASSSECDGVRIWALDIDDLLGIARRAAGRSLTVQECREYLRMDRCPGA
jgi:WD40 repeat protein/DNA-binding SARP family transcriptional activator/tRNA A-37 threonylcarbamoyl transferase component Bud32